MRRKNSMYNRIARIFKRGKRSYRKSFMRRQFESGYLIGIQIIVIFITAIIILLTQPDMKSQATEYRSDAMRENIAHDVTQPKRKVKKVSLVQRYKRLAGVHYADNIQPHLKAIDKVLKIRGYEDNEKFIQVMFYVGQHESHWNTGSVSGAAYGGEHATGIFQFLPSTFRSVSSGNIYSAEDQVDAFVTMYERDRLDEYGVMYICGFGPCLSYDLKLFAFNP